MSKELTGKQKLFADEYLIDLNASAAYKRAGYIGKGATADVQGSKLLRNPKVAEYISARQKSLQEKMHITQERVLAEYAKLAFLDPRKFFKPNGDLIPITELDDSTAAALSGMDIVENRGEGGLVVDYTKKIKMIDKKGALDSIARILGMFKDKTEISGANGGPVEMKVDSTLSPTDAYLKMIGKK